MTLRLGFFRPRCEMSQNPRGCFLVIATERPSRGECRIWTSMRCWKHKHDLSPLGPEKKCPDRTWNSNLRSDDVECASLLQDVRGPSSTDRWILADVLLARVQGWKALRIHSLSEPGSDPLLLVISETAAW